MKVLLFNPPNPPSTGKKRWDIRELKFSGYKGIGIFPISMSMIAEEILNFKGIQLKTIDGRMDNLDYEKYRSLLGDYNPDLVFVLVGMYSVDWDSRFLDIPFKSVMIPCPDTLPVRRAMEIYTIKCDYILSGIDIFNEIQQLLGLMNNGGNNEYIRKGDPYIIKANYKRKYLPKANFRYFDVERYFRLQERMQIHGRGLGEGPFVYMFTQYGCPYQCSFCSQAKNNFIRIKKPSDVLAEIEYFYNIGYRNFVFIDNEIGITPGRMIEICKEIIKNKFDIVWSCENRVDMIDEEVYNYMKRAGCTSISYGIETLSDESREKLYNKKFSLKEIDKTIKIHKKLDLEMRFFLIMGHPHETENSLERGYTNLKKVDYKLKSSYSLGRLFPTPGSEIESKLRNENRLMSEKWEDYYTKNTIRYTPEETTLFTKWTYKFYFEFLRKKIRRRLPSHNIIYKQVLLIFLKILIYEDILIRIKILYPFWRKLHDYLDYNQKLFKEKG